MARVFVIIGIVAVSALGSAMAMSFDRATYVEESCEVDAGSDYAVISMDTVSAVGKHLPSRYNIQFDPKGIVLRFPPEFYAPDWTQIEDISMKYLNTRSGSGILAIRLHDIGGNPRLETIGSVKRSCWETVKKYIRTRVGGKGIQVRMSESIAG
jgi:hypothetical protein